MVRLWVCRQLPEHNPFLASLQAARQALILHMAGWMGLTVGHHVTEESVDYSIDAPADTAKRLLRKLDEAGLRKLTIDVYSDEDEATMARFASQHPGLQLEVCRI